MDALAYARARDTVHTDQATPLNVALAYSGAGEAVGYFTVKGITAYLVNCGTIANVQVIVVHKSPRITNSMTARATKSHSLKSNASPFEILIDTCVWLDLAKDYQQQAILTALEELVRHGKVALILPQTVVDEFARNKVRVVEESSRILSGTLKRVKEAVEKFGDPRRKAMVLSQLNDVDHRLPMLGNTAATSVVRIKALFAHAPITEISDAVKLRAAQRGMERRAPFHRQRNGIDYAILVEVYAEAVSAKSPLARRFAFVMHNTKDFSHPAASNKLPYPDLAACFSRVKSLYFITLGEALRASIRWNSRT
jgi:hypothetical protein